MRASWCWVVLMGVGCAAERTSPAERFEAPRGAAVVPDAWLVELEDPPAARGGRKPRLDVQHRELRESLDRAELSYRVRHDFKQVWNGVALTLPQEQLHRLLRVAGVKAVFPVLQVDADPLSLPTPSPPGALVPTSTPPPGDNPELFTALVQTGADVAQNTLGLTGAGIRVGIIDTGTDFTNPDLGGCFGTGCRVGFGYDFVGDAFDGSLATTQPVPDATPNDCRGHGTHVSGIIMANGRVKGVAPGATLGSYRVFGCNGPTSTDLIIAGLERAMNDGMRVVNISIGSPFQWPQYPTAAAASSVRAMGVILTTSQGNRGTNGLFATSAPAAGDDALAAASVDNSGFYQPAFTISPDNLRVAYEPASSSPIAPITGSAPIAGMPTGNTLACAALVAGSLTGRVALIPRGTCTYAAKAQNAQAAGAVAVVIFNNVAGLLQMPLSGVTVPTMMISQADGNTITSRLGAGVTLTWGSSVNTPQALGGTISYFSSMGPNPELTLKPDVSTPGGNIYSTWLTSAGTWANISGTSMSAAHLAGVSALMLQAQPALTPLEIADVLRNTAQPVTAPSSTNLEPTLRQGAGLVRVDVAAQARTRVTPSRLSLGESEQGPATRVLTLVNSTAGALTFTPTHAAALSVIGSAYAPTLTAAGQANVVFSAPSVLVPAGGSATISATITVNSMLPLRSFYSGFLVFTAGTTVMRVPYLGFSGDYQSMVVMNVPDAGPFLSRGPGPAFPSLTDGGTFTLQPGDTPTVVIHVDHFARWLKLEAFDAVTGKPWGTIALEEYVYKDDAVTTRQWLEWDGTTTFDKVHGLLPNGSYVVRVTALKPLGDAGTPAHVETWTSPAVTLNHP